MSLTNWNQQQKLQLEIPGQSSALTDFPVLVHLSNSSGVTGFDCSDVFAKLGQQNQGEVLSTAPVAHWTMDNVSGSTLVDEKGNYDGTITNMTQLDGGVFSGQYLEGGSVASVARYVDFTSVPFQSISFWVKRLDLSLTANILKNSTLFAVQEDVDGNYLYFYDGSPYNSDLVLNDLDWHHICIVEGSDNNTHWIYLDKTKSSSEVHSGLSGQFIYFGKDNTISTQETVCFDNVQVFDFKLTDVDIEKLYNAGVPSSKRIAFEYEDSGVQCYAEIESWDAANEKATLHVKVPSIPTSGTYLNFYYDETQPDNTAYIGDTGDTAAQRVWDSNFVAVYHMAQDPSGTAPQILDSTSNANHGTSYGSMTSSDLIDGLTGKAIEFDGTDDYVGGLPSPNDINTVEVLLYQSSNTDQCLVTWDVSGGNHDYDFRLCLDSTNKQVATWDTDTEDGTVVYGTVATTSGEWCNVTCTQGTDTFTHYFDGDANGSSGISAHLTGTVVGRIGRQYADSLGGGFFNGQIQEVRLSNIARSSSWIYTTNLSLRDTLLTFSNIHLWNKDQKIQLEIPGQSSALTDFPVLVHLSNSSGVTGFDCSDVFAKLGQQNQGEVLSTAPVAHWTMDNVSGSTLVDEKGNYDGTITNMTQLDGGMFSGQYLEGGSIASTARYVDFTSVPFRSISLWVKRLDLNNLFDILEDTSASRFVCIRTQSDGNYLYVYNSGGTDLDLVVDDLDWHHICIVEGSDNNNHWIYLDKVRASSEVDSGFAGAFKCFGRTNTVSAQEVACFDNVQVFDFKLTDVDIEKLYNAGVPSSKRIAFEYEDSGVQCYAEIESWPAEFNNVVGSGVSSSSSNYSATYDSSKAFDGDVTTRWNSAGASTPPEWIKYDLGAGNEKVVTRMGLKAVDDANGSRVDDFEIYGSNDDSTWILLYSDTHGQGEGFVYYDFQNNTAYRYYRLDVTSNELNESVSIYEIEYYEHIQSATLHVKVPSIPTSGTYLNFYYDETQPDNTAYVGSAGDVNSIFVGDPGSSDEGWGGSYQLRVVIDQSELNSGGNRVKIKLQHVSQNWSVDEMWVGNQADSGDAYDFDGNQVQVTFNGGDTSSGTVSEEIYTDIVSFNLDLSKSIIVSLDVSTTSYVPKASGTGKNVRCYYKAVAGESGDSDVTGYTALTQGDIFAIRDVVSVPAAEVWDDNFVAVYHMAQDPSGTAPQMLDSTKNNRNMTSRGSMVSSDLIEGVTGRAVSFDGNDDSLYSSSFTNTSYTIDVLFEKTQATNNTLLSGYDSSDAERWDIFTEDSPLQIHFYADDAVYSGNTTPPVGSWVVSSITFGGGDLNFYYNGSSDGSHTTAHTLDFNYGMGVAARPDGSSAGGNAYNFTGDCQEIRISNVVRSSSWIKATGDSLRDLLITFSKSMEGVQDRFIPSYSNFPKPYNTSFVCDFRPSSVIREKRKGFSKAF